MTEYQLIGSRYAVHHIQARILPERLLIADIIENVNETGPRIHADDYRARVEKCERERLRIG
jgi:hypothetical protein